MSRQPRKLWQRIYWSAVYKCTSCHTFHALSRWEYYFSWNVSCRRCGQTDVSALPKRDQLDRMSYHPVSILQWLLGGSLYHCYRCREQFYDIRQRCRDLRMPSSASNPRS